MKSSYTYFKNCICAPGNLPWDPPGEMGVQRGSFGASRAPFGVSTVIKNHPEIASEEPKNEARK